MKSYFILFFYLLQSLNVYGFDLSTPQKDRIAIRKNPEKPRIFMVPRDQNGDSSTGIPLNTNDPNEFKKRLMEIESVEGRETFRDVIFFVTGIEIKNEKAQQAQFEKVLNDLNLQDLHTKVVVYSVASAVIQEQVKIDYRFFMEKFYALFPSMKRHYQTPLFAEATWGLTFSALSNTPNMIYMFHKYPTTDFLLTTVMHLSLLSVQTIFAKTYNNWMQASAARSDLGKKVEVFLKQLSMSFMYVTSYNVFGNFTPLVKYYHSHGMEGLLQAFPHAYLVFFVTQAPTVIINMIYYAVVNNMGFGRWQHQVDGVQRSQDARKLMPFMRLPTSAMNALLLSMASSQFMPLFHIGDSVINGGQVGLAVAAATGGFIFWRWPKILDPYLDLAIGIRGFLQAFYQNHFAERYERLRVIMGLPKKELPIDVYLNEQAKKTADGSQDQQPNTLSKPSKPAPVSCKKRT